PHPDPRLIHLSTHVPRTLHRSDPPNLPAVNKKRPAIGRPWLKHICTNQRNRSKSDRPAVCTNVCCAAVSVYCCCVNREYASTGSMSIRSDRFCWYWMFRLEPSLSSESISFRREPIVERTAETFSSVLSRLLFAVFSAFVRRA